MPVLHRAQHGQRLQVKAPSHPERFAAIDGRVAGGDKLRCPACNGDMAVQDSRQSIDADVVRRRRVCVACEVRYVTVERIEDVYAPAGRGRPKGSATGAKPKSAEPKVTKSTVKRQAAARRKVEDLMDERDDYSTYDDLKDTGVIWK